MLTVSTVKPLIIILISTRTDNTNPNPNKHRAETHEFASLDAADASKQASKQRFTFHV